MESSPSPQPDSPLQLEPTESPDGLKLRRSYPAITHFAVLGTFLLPFALVPYLLSRRQLSILRRRITSLETSNMALRTDLNAATAELGRAKDECRRIRGLLNEMVEEVDELKTEGQQREVSWKVANDSTRSELQRLLEQARQTRQHGEALHVLGVSLAEIAAFMHEMELSRHWMPLLQKKGDKSRVEQLRLVALQLQNLSPKPSKPNREIKVDQGKKE